jgi:5-methylcytosine-specific restriction protein A
MGKLTNLKPRLTPIAPRLAYLQGAADSGDHGAAAARPDKRKYNTARWKRLRWATLVRDLFTCQMCGKIEGDTSQLVADHKIPHRGSDRLFWDEANLWTLCKSPCHDKHKQAMEAGGRA